MKYYIQEYKDYLYIDIDINYLLKKKQEGKSVLLLQNEDEVWQGDLFDFPEVMTLDKSIIDYFYETTKEKDKRENQEDNTEESLKGLIKELFEDHEMKEYLLKTFCRQQKIPLKISEDDTLLVREFSLCDLERILEIYESNEGRRFLEPFYNSYEEAYAYLKDYIDYTYRLNKYCLWVAELKTDKTVFSIHGQGDPKGDWSEAVSKIVGLVGLVEDNNLENCRNNGENLELKFALHPDFYRQGYAKKMCQIVIDYALDSDYREIKSYFASDNERCKMLLRKLGFKLSENSACLNLL